MKKMLLVIFAACAVAAFAGAFAHTKSHGHESSIDRGTVRCAFCNGSGFSGNFNCSACQGSGRQMSY